MPGQSGEQHCVEFNMLSPPLYKGLCKQHWCPRGQINGELAAQEVITSSLHCHCTTDGNMEEKRKGGNMRINKWERRGLKEWERKTEKDNRKRKGGGGQTFTHERKRKFKSRFLLTLAARSILLLLNFQKLFLRQLCRMWDLALMKMTEEWLG